VNSKGNLSLGSNGAEIDVMGMYQTSCFNIEIHASLGNVLITTLSRQRTEPWPNPWSHPLPTFSYSEESKMITVKFYIDPVVSDHWPRAESKWREKTFALAARSVVGTVIPAFKKSPVGLQIQPNLLSDGPTLTLLDTNATPMRGTI